MQAEVFLFLRHLRVDDFAYESLNLRDEPDEDEGVGDVEAGVEGCQDERQFGCILHESRHLFGQGLVVSDKAAHHVDEWFEDTQYPDDAEHVEEHVGKGSAPCLRVGCHGCDVRRDGRSEVLAHHQCDALIDGEHA